MGGVKIKSGFGYVMGEVFSIFLNGDVKQIEGQESLVVQRKVRFGSINVGFISIQIGFSY